MLVRRSRKYNAYATEGGGVGHADVGKAHEFAYLDLSPICAQPKGNVAVDLVKAKCGQNSIMFCLLL
jgi:hypothetical protein